MIKDNNKIPDLQFESSGLQGWLYFKAEFEDIKKDYDLYGDIVLQKRLGKSIGIYEDAFTSSHFIHEIHKIWKERYHYVADSLDDLIILYEWAFEENIIWQDLLPDLCPHNPGETDGRKQVFALSGQLYECILRNAHQNKLFILKGKKVYRLTLIEREANDSFYKIRIDDIEVIEIDKN